MFNRVCRKESRRDLRRIHRHVDINTGNPEITTTVVADRQSFGSCSAAPCAISQTLNLIRCWNPSVDYGDTNVARITQNTHDTSITHGIRFCLGFNRRCKDKSNTTFGTSNPRSLQFHISTNAMSIGTTAR